MSGLRLVVDRRAAFGSIEEARAPLAALAKDIGAASALGGVWTRFMGEVLPLDARTIDLLLLDGKWIRAGLPGQPSHVIPLSGLPAGPGEIGLISLTVGATTDPPAKAPKSGGLRLTVTLFAPSFTAEADALLRLLGGCFDTVRADSGALGPAALVKELGAGWATATRRPGRDWLPSEATMVPTQTGAIVIAHREQPGCTSTSARNAVVRVHDALNGRSGQTSTPVARSEAIPVPRREVIPVPAVPIPSHAPSFTVATPPPPVPPAFRPSSDLAGTISVASMPVPHRPPADPLPFGITLSSEFMASLSAARPAAPHYEVGETLPLGANLLSAMLPALPFGHVGSAPPPVVPKPAPAPAPQLTLDAYASLCAELAVFPARTIDILRKYGVLDDTMKRELDQRWRDIFITAPPLRDEWQRKVASFGDWLRRGGR